MTLPEVTLVKEVEGVTVMYEVEGMTFGRLTLGTGQVGKSAIK